MGLYSSICTAEYSNTNATSIYSVKLLPYLTINIQDFKLPYIIRKRTAGSLQCTVMTALNLQWINCWGAGSISGEQVNWKTYPFWRQLICHIFWILFWDTQKYAMGTGDTVFCKTYVIMLESGHKVIKLGEKFRNRLFKIDVNKTQGNSDGQKYAT